MVMAVGHFDLLITFEVFDCLMRSHVDDQVVLDPEGGRAVRAEVAGLRVHATTVLGKVVRAAKHLGTLGTRKGPENVVKSPC